MKSNNKAAVFILLGQSNAVGHGTPMEAKDKIAEPLKNVFGLCRESNQSFENGRLYWSGYTSGGMNLAEERDHTYSVANCLAALWQNEIDSGNKYDLPDLYIVQIAIGAQGVTQGYMWNPEYELKLVPGKLGTVDISLFRFTAHILSLVRKSMDEMNKTEVFTTLHWRGGENDTTVSESALESSLEGIYTTLFDEFYQALGEKVPTVLHRIAAHERCLDLDPSGQYLKSMHCINRTFDKLSQENEHITVFDVRNVPHFDRSVRGNGIFIDDVVHYTAETNRCVAKYILDTYRRHIKIRL